MLSVLPLTCTYCINVIQTKLCSLLFFSVTVLLQGQFKVETTTSFQSCINVEATTLFKPHFNVVSTLKPQPYFNLVSTTFQRCIYVETTTLFQPSFNHISTMYQPSFNHIKYNHISMLMCDCCINVDTTLLCLLGCDNNNLCC